jgi:predicted AlkP superfamily phosphohydrolase/phosphomutase
VLLVLVLDSANLDLIERWMAEGKLPNTSAIWKNGLTARMGGRAYFDEVGSWLSVYSGTPSTTHGYYGARYLVPGTYDLRVRTLESSNAIPFWAKLPQDRFRTLVLEPVEGFLVPGLNGDQMVNLTVHQETYAAEPFRAIPEEFGGEVRRLFGPPPELVFNRFLEPLDYYKKEAATYHDVLTRRAKVFEQLIRRREYDVVIAGFNELHDCAHILWHFFDGRDRARDPKGELANGVQAMYEAVDREIGRLVEASPAGTTICLLSSYGVKDQYPISELAEKAMIKLGFTVEHETGGSQSFSPVSLARRFVPEPIRYAISKRLPTRVQENLIESRFQEKIDWNRTRACVIPTALFSTHVRVNLKGREPNGIVEPGAEYNALLDEIETEFKQLIDPKTGMPAVSAALRSANVHGEGPNRLLPDLYIHWRSGRHFVDRVVHPRAGELTQRQPEFHRNSFHQRPGFMALAGPGIDAHRMEQEVELEDIAPTLLQTLGIEQSQGVGRCVLPSHSNPLR